MLFYIILDLWGLQAWIVTNNNYADGSTAQIWTFDENKESVDGVYVTHNYYDNGGFLTGSTSGTASYRDYPNAFPNFTRGVFNQPERQDGKRWITGEGHTKLTYDTIGANAEVLGTDYGDVFPKKRDQLKVENFDKKLLT